ncbi:hypothetical protein HY025_00175 [Candidatus Daviesbacteria bacterium]|nr:hypothetical protein [Candidatus Daviesbacteria bacterium]
MRKFRNFFLPHPQTHQKAHLLTWEAMLIYVLFFIFLQVGFNVFSHIKPGVLGISSDINVIDLINDTNEQRAKLNLPALKENALLDAAAAAKAQNMFTEDYWAHYSPSGKDPWGFILSAGYKFSYAGENLARNFYTSSDVVNAWMESPTHKENIVNSRYSEIGMAVADGVLKGQKTTLVVQMFGTPFEAVATKPTVNVAGQKITLNDQQLTQTNLSLPISEVQAATKQNLPKLNIDPFAINKQLGLVLLGFIFLLLIIDFYVIKKRGVVRISSYHLSHLALLSIAASALLNMKPGSIL